VSGNGAFGSHSGLRAALNAWLEEISFRTGVIAGAVALVVVAAVGGAVAVFGQSDQAASALGSRSTVAPPTVAAPSAGGAAQPRAAPSSATPSRSAAATPAPARSAAAVSAPGTGSPAAVAAASGSSRESHALAGPAGWRPGLPSGWGARGWVWGPHRGGPHFGGPWW
jgi:hypothetical protein